MYYFIFFFGSFQIYFYTWKSQNESDKVVRKYKTVQGIGRKVRFKTVKFPGYGQFAKIVFDCPYPAILWVSRRKIALLI